MAVMNQSKKSYTDNIKVMTSLSYNLNSKIYNIYCTGVYCLLGDIHRLITTTFKSIYKYYLYYEDQYINYDIKSDIDELYKRYNIKFNKIYKLYGVNSARMNLFDISFTEINNKKLTMVYRYDGFAKLYFANGNVIDIKLLLDQRELYYNKDKQQCCRFFKWFKNDLKFNNNINIERSIFEIL